MKTDNRKNIIAFLHDPEIRALASKTNAIAAFQHAFDNASDYDVFNAICENLFLFGNSVRTLFLSLITPFLFDGESYETIYLPENRRTLWQRIFCEENKTVLIKRDFAIGDEKELALKKKDESRIFGIESELDASCDDIFSLLEQIISKIKKQKSEFLCMDLRNFSYARPDDFHASLEYDNFKKGKGGEDLIKLWLACRVLMNTKVNLLLKTDSIKKAEDVATLIFRLRLSPKIIVCADVFDNIDFSELYSFVMYNKEKSISVSLYTTKEMQFDNIDFAIERLSEIFDRLPMLCVESIDINPKILELTLKNDLSQYELDLALNHLYRVK